MDACDIKVLPKKNALSATNSLVAHSRKVLFLKIVASRVRNYCEARGGDSLESKSFLFAFLLICSRGGGGATAAALALTPRAVDESRKDMTDTYI